VEPNGEHCWLIPLRRLPSVEGIFSGGDLVLGLPRLSKRLGAGKLAAEGIDRYLRGLPQPKMPPVPARRMRVELTETSSFL